MNVVIRTDATAQVGTGHLMRCLTLARRLRADGASVMFVCASFPERLDRIAEAEGFAVRPIAAASPDEDARSTIDALGGDPDWLVVDHYGLDADWETRLRPHVRRILAIDDRVDRIHHCDVLLDQNVREENADACRTRVPEVSECWLGPSFLLLREEFAAATRAVPRAAPPHRVLITFGGVDAADNTSRALEAIQGIRGPETEIDVVIGSSHPARAGIEAACERPGIRCHVQAANMAELMARSHTAIAACGFTAYELVAMAVPTVLFPVSDLQATIARALAHRGVAVALPAGHLDPERLRLAWQRLRDSPEAREEIRRACRGLVDGHGAERVVRGLKRLAA